MRQRASRPARPPATATRRLCTAIATALVSVIAVSGAAVVGTSFAGSAANLIINSSFEHNLAGWSPLSSPSRLARARDGHDSGWSAALSDTSADTSADISADISADTVALKDAPNTVRDTGGGQGYHASVWVKAPDGVVDAVLRIREVKGGRLVGQRAVQLRLIDTGWHKIAFDYETRSTGGSLDYNVLARNLVVGRVLLVDDTWLSTPVGTPPPTTPPPPPPTPPPGHTLFGTSIFQNPGESFAAAYRRRVGIFGPLAIDRVFYPGLPSAWPGNAGYSGGPVIVSFKVDPQQVLTGAYDAILTSWFATAPRGRLIWWTYYHEPEGHIASGAFTAAEYRAAWQRIADLAGSVGNPDLHATLILMCYTLDRSSGRSFTDYYPGSDYIDTVGFDCYNTSYSSGRYITAAMQFSAVLSLSASLGKPYGIAEFGSQLVPGDSGAARAAWLEASAAYLDAHNAEWVSYFDSPVAGEYRLLDAPSQAAWRAVVTTM